jgi:hypothetical protein
LTGFAHSRLASGTSQRALVWIAAPLTAAFHTDLSIRARRVIIRHAVAVFVFSIASRFVGLGLDSARARSPLALAASSSPGSTCSARVASARLVGSIDALAAFVDLIIAVVVL